jgi:hypothetical protein
MDPSPWWSLRKQYQPETYFANGFDVGSSNPVQIKKFHHENRILRVFCPIWT